MPALHLDGAPVPSAGIEITVPTVDPNAEKHTTDETVVPVSASASYQEEDVEQEDVEQKDEREDDEAAIIVTGADASKHLLPLRDDGDPTVTFRALFLGSILSCFEATMSQIYTWKPTFVEINGAFIVLIAYFLGNAWARIVPRGDRLEARWRERGGTGKPPWYIVIFLFLNNGPWGLKEHGISAIMATSASSACGSIQVMAAQTLFHDVPLNYTTVILSVISIGLFGYGVAGFVRPIGVWSVDAVYWSTLPTVKTLQGLHWGKKSDPMRCFWYSFAVMAVWQFFPSYIFPMLNAISIPCIAAMRATGEKAAILTNIFGGSLNNEGLGWFSISLDWQYVGFSGFGVASVLMLT